MPLFSHIQKAGFLINYTNKHLQKKTQKTFDQVKLKLHINAKIDRNFVHYSLKPVIHPADFLIYEQDQFNAQLS